MSGELTPLAVVESLLPLIRRDIDKPSHHSISFIDCHPEAVIEAAKASTLRYKAGKPLSSKSNGWGGHPEFRINEILLTMLHSH